ncbi:arsenic transporter [Sphingobacterium sp. UGAL515B_05]|uniref:arsenic transporter n=1 Tax=Sphingobacterium sp. UGAL515B_05 TaxID=2986767 RepID=UPI0029544EDE|nr:arsenic transporter [Sphingobacterium sp. UGAL515B_05]WON93695.1 arsenic transporter [Sphingobacterium sp. UGAL515B_05]
MSSNFYIFLIAAFTTAGVIIRPFKIQEAMWAAVGAILLILFGLISFQAAWTGIGKGLDVYLFLIGMMSLAESARREGLFDWLASHAIKLSAGSTTKLFVLIYLVGIVVTIFMSNDATAVVLTPAVALAASKAKVKNPLPYLLICAFIANAASFVLPISNPANLVIYGDHMPSLASWLARYTLPSILSIGVTFLILYLTQKNNLALTLRSDIVIEQLARGGKMALAGIVFTSLLLMLASAKKWNLGYPTVIAGVSTALLVSLAERKNPIAFFRHISWSVIPLVAGLFVLVEAVQQTGLIGMLAQHLSASAEEAPGKTSWLAGIIIGVGSNVINNLPAGLIAGTALSQIQLPDMVRGAVLIGVDLGPNLSITGSLATILWLNELRRHGYTISAWRFLKLGLVIMIPALLAALLALLI